MNQKPIFILGAHKSGTSLLRSIFDGHTELFTIPFETHCFQHLNYWINNEYRKQFSKPFDIKQISENFINWILHCNSIEDKYADSITKNLLNEKLFKEKFHIKEQFDKKDIIELYFESIYYSIYDKYIPDKLRIVEKSVENAEFATDLSNIFPEAKFIHIIRNPYSNIVALRKFKSKGKQFALINRVLSTLYDNFYFLSKNERNIKNYFILKYEELLGKPKEYIKEVCDFIEIPFQESLLQPSSMGKPWLGNSMYNNQYTEISKTNINKWKNEIHPMEIYYINKILLHVLNDFGYEKIHMNGSFWKPAKGENVKGYLYNRIYKYYCK